MCFIIASGVIVFYSIVQLTTELEQVKKQLLDKECLLKSYLKHIEDLRQNAEVVFSLFRNLKNVSLLIVCYL